jgi:phosphoribosylanthranilate isomerase
VKVKICGITEKEDALSAVELGVDALGFIFASSPRQVTPEGARRIIEGIPPFIKTVGVFVNEDLNRIREHIDYCGLDLVQLHGEESPDVCRDLMPCTIKALRIKDESSLSNATAYHSTVRALLLDTFAKDKAGGTGKTFDWQLANKIKNAGIPVILSGGLGPTNILDAIEMVKPYAVDVNSGVEESPGKKSIRKMEELMDKVGKSKKMNVQHRTSNVQHRMLDAE